MASIVERQEATLRARAEETRSFSDLIYFYAAQNALDTLDGLATDLDPKNEGDMLAFELFQGTGAKALLPLLREDVDPWVRHSLLKALLKDGALDEAMTLWKRSISWQNPDLLIANTLAQYLLANGRFDEANNVLPVCRKLAPGQPENDAWQALIASSQPLDRELRLDPAPPDSAVAFFLSTRDAEAFLEQTLDGIAAQNHPIAEVLVVNDGNLANLDRLQAVCPFRIIDGEGGLPDDIDVAYFAMVPADGAPAMDYVQQFLLALENGPEKVGRLAGRVEDFYQETPGDRWRMFRMSPTLPEHRIVGDDLPATGAAFRPREAPAGGTALYIPEAVVCGLQQDTIDSALTRFWKSQLPARNEAGHFQSAESLIANFDTHRERMVTFINEDIDEGRSSLIFPDFLTLFHAVAMDAQLGVAQGLFDESTAAAIQTAVLNSIGELDREYKRNLTGKVREQLGERLLGAAPADTLPAEVDQAISAFVGKLNALYNSFPQDLYLAIYG